MQSSTSGSISQPDLLARLISERANVVDREVQMRMRFDHLLPGDVKKLFEAEFRAVLALASSGLETVDDDVDG
jgi:hypothetical protein